MDANSKTVYQSHGSETPASTDHQNFIPLFQYQDQMLLPNYQLKLPSFFQINNFRYLQSSTSLLLMSPTASSTFQSTVQIMPFKNIRSQCSCPNCVTGVSKKMGNNEKRHICHLLNCGKKFRRPYELKDHLIRHLNERPYECPFQGCGKRFASKYGLKLHNKYHTGEKTHKCQICGHAFMTKQKLQRHNGTHLKMKNSELVPLHSGNVSEQKKLQQQEQETPETGNNNLQKNFIYASKIFGFKFE